MTQVYVLERCDFCDGEAYLFAGETVSAVGEYAPYYEPCEYCHGSGEMDKWLDVSDFLAMLTAQALKEPLEPDWLELVTQRPVD